MNAPIVNTIGHMSLTGINFVSYCGSGHRKPTRWGVGSFRIGSLRNVKCCNSMSELNVVIGGGIAIGQWAIPVIGSVISCLNVSAN
jgi:hypothetical protein